MSNEHGSAVVTDWLGAMKREDADAVVRCFRPVWPGPACRRTLSARAAVGDGLIASVTDFVHRDEALAAAGTAEPSRAQARHRLRPPYASGVGRRVSGRA